MWLLIQAFTVCVVLPGEVLCLCVLTVYRHEREISGKLPDAMRPGSAFCLSVFVGQYWTVVSRYGSQKGMIDSACSACMCDRVPFGADR